MAERRPQINFQVDQALKRLYEEAKLQGHWVTRFCAAGLLLMVEDPQARQRALSRLRDWEAEFANASEKQVRAFVEGAQVGARRGARGGRPARKGRTIRKKAKRG